MKAERIHIDSLIRALMMIYHEGVEFVDLEHKNDEKGEPSIFLSFKDDYFMDDEDDDADDNDDNEFRNININDLL